MQKTNLCSSSDNQMIKIMSEVLEKIGIEEGFQNYYENDNYPLPFFKIPKKFKKESQDDPDTCYIYVDVDKNEYTVHGRYIHEHIQNEFDVAELVLGLLTGTIVEVAIFFPNKMAGFFMPSLGDPRKNVAVIDHNAKTIMEHLSSSMASSLNFHGHVLFQPVEPYFLQVGAIKQPQLQGAQIYMVSSVFAEHPEYFIIA